MLGGRRPGRREMPPSPRRPNSSAPKPAHAPLQHHSQGLHTPLGRGAHRPPGQCVADRLRHRPSGLAPSLRPSPALKVLTWEKSEGPGENWERKEKLRGAEATRPDARSPPPRAPRSPAELGETDRRLGCQKARIREREGFTGQGAAARPRGEGPGRRGALGVAGEPEDTHVRGHAAARSPPASLGSAPRGAYGRSAESRGVSPAGER